MIPTTSDIVRKLNIPPETRRAMYQYLLEKIEGIPTETPTLTIAEYAERRIMPQSNPRPGPWNNRYTPYLVEPMESLSPMSPIQREIILKAAQGGWTAMAENVLCYYMDLCPSDILFMSAGDDLLERWATRRLEPAIDTFGIRKKIYLENTNAKTRRSGDKVFSKDYQGCRLDMASSRSASKMRATDKRILIRDEIDGVKAQLATGEGYWLDVSWVRTNAWGDRRKVMDFGTPTTYDNSETWKAYLQGDQRKFLVACPICGAFQELEFGSDKTQYGLKPIYAAGSLEEVVYQCKHCRDEIHEHQKDVLLNSGHWEPTTKSSRPTWRSRHWSSLYSPRGMLSWREVYEFYEEAKEKPGGMRGFTNLYLGLPYKEEGTRISAQRLVSLKSTYKRGTVPDGVLFTTVGLDVQRGSQTDEKNPPRLEFEVMGTGKNRRTWSIDYHRIEGAVGNAYEGAWEDLYQMICNGEINYSRNDGTTFAPKRILLDSGDGESSDVVYEFAERLQNVFPSKGMGTNYVKEPNVDKRSANDTQRYKYSKLPNGGRLYIISTNEYKRIMRAALRVKRQATGEQDTMFCEFPSDYDNPEQLKKYCYFKMLNAEELLEDGSFDSGGRRNEATDCRVYAMCAAEIFLNDMLDTIRTEYRKQGYSDIDCRGITTRHILQKLEQDLPLKRITA